MNKIVNGVANDFEFDINDYNMFPPNVEKIIITKENYNRLFKDLQEKNMYLRDKVEQLQDRIDSAIHDLEYITDYFKKHKNELPKQSDYIKDVIYFLKNGF